MKNKEKLIPAVICGLTFAVLIVLLRTVDVAPIGPAGTSIGLSHINQAVFSRFGVNMLWYNITDWLGIAAIVAALCFAILGLVQLIRERSLVRVDRELLLLGGLYLIVIGLYVLFEIVIVNYRPVIMPDATGPEASFPSSHTMLVCIIMGSTMMLLPKYIRNESLRLFLKVLCGIIIGVTVIGRLISGVHWFTDIVGGILLSIALLSLFSWIKDYTQKEI